MFLFVSQVLYITCVCFCLYPYNLMICNSDVLSAAKVLHGCSFFFSPVHCGLENVVLGSLGSGWHCEDSRIFNSFQCLSPLWFLYQFCLSIKNSLFQVWWHNIIQGVKSKLGVVCHEMLTKWCGHSLVRELQRTNIDLFSVHPSKMIEGFSRLYNSV